MAIDKIGPSSNIQPPNRTNRASKASHVQGKDRVEISEQARVEADRLRQLDMIKQAPDIREEKIAEVRERLASYTADGGMNDEVANTIYDRIIDSLLG